MSRLTAAVPSADTTTASPGGRGEPAVTAVIAPRIARLALGIVLVVGASGCDSKPSGSGAPETVTSGAGSASSAAPPPSAVEPAPPPPADLDVAAMQKALACGGNAKSGPCVVLAAFATCKPWSAEVPSGDGRWLGRGFEVDGKTTTDQVAVMRVRRVPTGEVGPGQLPARVALGSIAKDEGAPFNEADKAIRALERSDVPPRGNAAIEHLKAMTQWSEAFVTRTTGGQVYGLSHGGLYMCEGPKRELYVVRRASTRTGAGDGFYATLWGATW